MRHALNVGPGFRIAEFSRPRHTENELLLALADLAGALIDQRGDGSFVPMEGPGTPGLSIPQWVIGTF